MRLVTKFLMSRLRRGDVSGVNPYNGIRRLFESVFLRVNSWLSRVVRDKISRKVERIGPT